MIFIFTMTLIFQEKSQKKRKKKKKDTVFCVFVAVTILIAEVVVVIDTVQGLESLDLPKLAALDRNPSAKRPPFVTTGSWISLDQVKPLFHSNKSFYSSQKFIQTDSLILCQA